MASTSRPRSSLARVADWSYQHRWKVVLIWVVLLIGSIVASSTLSGEFRMTFSVPGSESDEAQDLLRERFPARAGDTVELVFEAEAGVDDPAVRSHVESVLAEATNLPRVTSLVSPYSPEGSRQIAPDRKIAYAALQLDTIGDELKVEDGRKILALAQQADRPGITFEASGFALQTAEEIEFSSEIYGFLVAIMILLISFGSVLAMGLPVLTALMGLGIGTGVIALLANVLEVPPWAPQVAAMIGIGVGIDYVLFIVTRYRSGLHAGLEPREAVHTAMTTSGRAVMFAGCVVIISIMGLFVMNLPFLRGVAVAAACAVLLVMLASVTLLPAVLGFVGRTIDRLRVPLVNRRLAGDRRSLSYRWSRVVQRRPWPALIVSFVILVALALPTFGMNFGFPDAGTSPREYTTRRAYDLLAKGFGPGFNGPLFLVVDGLENVPTGALEALPERIRSAPGVAATSPPIISPDGSVAMILAFPTSSPQSDDTERLVNRLREDVLPQAIAGTQARVLVTGPTAGSIDATRYIAERLPLFIGAVIILSFLLLLVVFRSLLVAIKAALMNILSIGAAYGIVAVMVQGGWFGGIFGIDEAVPVPSFIPMMMFAVLFGLSMDYEVFLLSRVREEYLRTRVNATAVADGLAATARVITAAAAIMIAVFLSFVLGDQVFLKMIGVGMASAILVDATLVRMVLVPSTMELLGNANWWLPKWLDRILPDVHVEGADVTLDAELDQLLAEEKAVKS